MHAHHSPKPQSSWVSVWSVRGGGGLGLGTLKDYLRLGPHLLSPSPCCRRCCCCVASVSRSALWRRPGGCCLCVRGSPLGTAARRLVSRAALLTVCAYKRYACRASVHVYIRMYASCHSACVRQHQHTLRALLPAPPPCPPASQTPGWGRSCVRSPAASGAWRDRRGLQCPQPHNAQRQKKWN